MHASPMPRKTPHTSTPTPYQTQCCPLLPSSGVSLERHANPQTPYSPTPHHHHLPAHPSHRTILINKPNIPGPLRIPPHKLLIPRRPLGPRVPRQHALDAHAHAFDILNGAPALGPKEIKADDAVAVDVGVEGDGAGRLGEGEEGYFRGFCWVCVSFGGGNHLGVGLKRRWEGCGVPMG